MTVAAKGVQDWRTDAMCRQFDPEIWFPIGHSAERDVREQHALEICRRCPVRTECTTWAVDHAVLEGVWGVPQAELVRMVRDAHGGYVQLRKAACGFGHPLTTANTYVDGRGKRSCRECRNRRRAEHKQALREAAMS